MPNFVSLKRTLALALHYIYSLRRNPARLIEIFLWPSFELMLFILLGQGIDVNQNGISVGNMIAAGALYWILTARIIQEIVAQATEDFFSKNIQNIMLAPVKLLEIIMGLLIATLAKLALSFLVLLLLLKILGSPALFSVFLANLPWLIILVLFAGALGIFSLVFVFLFGERMSFIGWIVSTVVQVLSCVYYAREVLPFPLYEFSLATPSSYVFESIRSGTLPSWPILVLLCLLYYVLSLVLIKYSFYYARKNGSFTKS